jgi:hypothetical protein
MSGFSSMFGHLPGMGTVVESFELAYCWGPYPRYFIGGYIDSATADPTNTPTWEVRKGLVMGIVRATGTWKNYSPTATDGSEVACGVLTESMRMQDVLSGVNTAKFYAIMVSGGVQGAKLIGLDGMARAQMSQAFYFDDDLPGRQRFDWNRFQSKTADYTIVAADNMSVFDNTGAVGAVVFTLPALANGLKFGFRVVADQTVTVASAEGDNIVAFNDASADSLAFSTGGAKVGGGLNLYSNPGATKWVAENTSIGANTITVAT